MITKSEFKPTGWIANPHLQTMLPTLIMDRKPPLSTRHEEIELSDGDNLELEWYGPDTGPIIVMIHGVTGDIDSAYIKYGMPEFAQHGWRSVMIYYRGYGMRHNRTTSVTHAGHTDDLSEVLNVLHQREPSTPIVAIGYSQGANMLLKYLGEVGKNTPLTCAVAVSPPFQLRAISNCIRYGVKRFYQWYLLRQLRHFFREKFQYRPAPFDIEKLNQYKSFWHFDDNVTAPVSGFKGAVDYYKQASCLNYLSGITIPTLIIHAKDDSIMTPDIIPTASQISNSTTLELSEKGGHLGFIYGSLFNCKFWLNERIPSYLTSFLP